MARKTIDFQNKLYFPIAVSADSPESILCRILRLAVSKDKESDQKREGYDERRKKGFLKSLEEAIKTPAFAEWAEKEFSFKTIKDRRLIKPYHASAEINISENYGKLFEQMIRAGRPDDKSSEVLKKFCDVFTATENVDDITTKLYCDLSTPEFVVDSGAVALIETLIFSSKFADQPFASKFFSTCFTRHSSKVTPSEQRSITVFKLNVSLISSDIIEG